MKKIFIIGLIIQFFLPIKILYSQPSPGCPNVYTTLPGSSIPINDYYLCDSGNINIEAHPFNVGATDQYIVTSIPYAPPFPFDAGSPVPGNYADDKYLYAFDLPFKFCFFGEEYEQVVVGTNGIITFNTDLANEYCPWSFSVSLPNSSLPTNAIMCYHDIYPLTSSGSGCGYLRYGVLGTYPCRAFVLNFDQVCHFNVQNIKTTMQIVLYEGTSAIEFHIQSKPVHSGWNGGRCALGIQNSDGTIAYFPPNRNTGVWTATNEAWRFTPSGTPINIFQWYLNGDPQPVNQTSLNSFIDSNATAVAIATYNVCGFTQIVVKDTVRIHVAHLDLPYDTISICQGDSITLTADTTGAFSQIQWSNGMDGNIIHFLPDTSQMIYVNAYFPDGNYCTDSVYINVIDSVYLQFIVNDTPLLDGESFNICRYDTAHITVTGANSYIWSSGDTLSQISVSPDNATTYTVTGNISSCADTASITIGIHPNPNPSIKAIPKEGCIPLVVSFTSKTDVPITQYLWYLSNGVTSHQSSFTYKFNYVGTYDAKLVVESVDGCKDSVFVPGIVSTYPLPNVAFSMSSHSIFTDEPLVIFTNESDADSYEWQYLLQNQSVIFSNDVNPSYEFTMPGNYTIILTGYTDKGCMSQAMDYLEVIGIYSLYVPTAFSPHNKDGLNDYFYPYIYGLSPDPDSYSIMIFDRWGKLVFYSTDINAMWDGTIDGHDAKPGVYIWKITLKYNNNIWETQHGEFLLLE
jgi:gliding motility-associated-like protein